ncbi:hypothetical protein BDV96DRAFT_205659 [Lophiotrema nucula]|uniref:Uncharacterized protein n=1 Tax=Lophiotrema nucula TaxID=690887 RepID=A0A6A5ZQP2_9PLEO|nr:hypothetical protein BDV96DRAFT_205659 [Lophiotrema nucula]
MATDKKNDTEYSLVHGDEVETLERPSRPDIARVSTEDAKKAARNRFSKRKLLLHGLPVAITAGIIAIHAREVYWLDLNTSKADVIGSNPLPRFGRLISQKVQSQRYQLKYLQFAAKVHELLVALSLSSILMGILHRRLLRSGIPLGLLDAPSLIGAGGGLDVVFRTRFWATFRSNRSLIFFFLLCTLLTLLLAPSSAIAVIPSLGWWKMQGRYKVPDLRVYVRSWDVNPWPVKWKEEGWGYTDFDKCKKLGTDGNPDCPGAGWDQISQWAFGNVVTGSTTNLTLTEPYTNSQRLLLSRSLNSTENPYQGTSRRVSTANSALNDAALGGLWRYIENSNYGDIGKLQIPLFESTAHSATYQPLVYSECSSEIFNLTHSASKPLEVRRPKGPWYNRDYQEANILRIEPSDDMLADLPSKEPLFKWYDQDGVTAFSLAILPFRLINSTYPNGTQSSIMVGCSYDARWLAASLSLEPRASSLVKSNLSSLEVFEKYHNDKELLQRNINISRLIEMPRDWLRTLSFSSAEDDRNRSNIVTFFNEFTDPTEGNTTHFAMKNSTSVSMGGDLSQYRQGVEDFISMTLGITITDGLARQSYTRFFPLLELPSSVGNRHSDYVDLILSGYFKDKLNITDFLQNYTIDALSYMDFTVSRYGYGYGFQADDKAVYFAIAVLGTYLLVVVVHVLIRGFQRLNNTYVWSSSWETLPNLVALALNSKIPENLEGASAGIKNKDTWKMETKVRVLDSGRLNLVVCQPGEDQGQRPEVSKKYM